MTQLRPPPSPPLPRLLNTALPWVHLASYFSVTQERAIERPCHRKPLEVAQHALLPGGGVCAERLAPPRLWYDSHVSMYGTPCACICMVCRAPVWLRYTLHLFMYSMPCTCACMVRLCLYSVLTIHFALYPCRPMDVCMAACTPLDEE